MSNTTDTVLSKLNIFEGTKAQIEAAIESGEITSNDLSFISDIGYEEIFRYVNMPTPDYDNEGKIVEYIGATNADYTQGYFYKCGITDTVISACSLTYETDATDLGTITTRPEAYKEYFSVTGDETVTIVMGNGIWTRIEEDGTESGKVPSSVFGVDFTGNAHVGDTIILHFTDNRYAHTWNQLDVQPRESVEVKWGEVKGDIEDQSDLQEEFNTKQEVFQLKVMPTDPDEIRTYRGKVVQYIGDTTEDYHFGYFYKVVEGHDHIAEIDWDKAFMIDDEFKAGTYISDYSKIPEFVESHKTGSYFTTYPDTLRIACNGTDNWSYYFYTGETQVYAMGGVKVATMESDLGIVFQSNVQSSVGYFIVDIYTEDQVFDDYWKDINVQSSFAVENNLRNVSATTTSIYEAHAKYDTFELGIDNSVVLGVNAHSQYDNATVIGYNTDAASQSVAIGTNAASASESEAIGYNTSSGPRGVAVGHNANTYACTAGVALGYNAKVQANNSVQLGTGTNNSLGTLQFRSYTLLYQSGLIPWQRLSSITPVEGSVLAYDSMRGCPVWKAFNQDIQVSSLPAADREGKVVQYVGDTDEYVTQGYFYISYYDADEGDYLWKQVNVQPEPVLSVSYNNVSDKPTINNVEIAGDLSWTDLGLAKVAESNDYRDLTNKPALNGYVLTGNRNAQDIGFSKVALSGSYNDLKDKPSGYEVDSELDIDSTNPVQNKIITEALNNLQEAIQVSRMPSATADNVGKIYQYVGITNANYTNGYFYIGTETIDEQTSESTYSWKQKDVQPGTSEIDWSNINNKPETFTPASHSHDVNDISNYKTVTINQAGTTKIKFNVLDIDSNYSSTINFTFDSTLNNSSTNAPQTKAVYTAVSKKQDTMQYATMPNITNAMLGSVAQYVGDDTIQYTKGHFYTASNIPVDSSITITTESETLSDLSVDKATWEDFVGTSDNITVFTYNEGNWAINETIVALSDFGITYTGTPAELDTIQVEYLAASAEKQWVEISLGGDSSSTRHSPDYSNKVEITEEETTVEKDCWLVISGKVYSSDKCPFQYGGLETHQYRVSAGEVLTLVSTSTDGKAYLVPDNQ